MEVGQIQMALGHLHSRESVETQTNVEEGVVALRAPPSSAPCHVWTFCLEYAMLKQALPFYTPHYTYMSRLGILHPVYAAIHKSLK